MKRKTTPAEAARKLSLRLWDFIDTHDNSFQAVQCHDYYVNLNQELNRLEANEKQKKIDLLNIKADTLLNRSSNLSEAEIQEYPLRKIHTLEEYISETLSSFPPFHQLRNDVEFIQLFTKLYEQEPIFFWSAVKRLSDDIYDFPRELTIDEIKAAIAVKMTIHQYPVKTRDDIFVQGIIEYCQRYCIKIPTAMYAQKYAMTKIAERYYRIDTAEKQVFKEAKELYLREANKLQSQAQQLLSELAAL